MQNILLSLFLLVTLGLTIAAQNPTNTEDSEILNREKDWRTSLLKAGDGIEEIYSKNLTYNDWSGTTHDRAKLIADVKAGQLHYKAMKASKETVQVFINTAIYTCDIEIEGNYGETSISRVAHILHVWVKESGTWRLIVHQTQKSN